MIHLRTDIENCFTFPESGGIYIIECGQVQCMIGLTYQLMGGWLCSVWHAPKSISTFWDPPNGNLKTGMKIWKLHNLLLELHRLPYRPQLVVDGNMKLVHLKMKRPMDDVSLSDGELFMVSQKPYSEHLASRQQSQMVCDAEIID